MKKNLFLALVIAASVSFSGLAQTTPSGNKKEKEDKKTEKRDSTYKKKGTMMPPTGRQDTIRRDTTGKK